MSPFYQAFGMNIGSEFVIPMLPPGGDGSDVVIRMGCVDEFSGNIVFESEEYKIGTREFLFRVPGVGEFFVSNGKTITVHPAPRSSIDDIYTYLLGTCIGAVLYQKGDVCLHGSVVKINGQGILIAGESGAGKSTVSSLLCKKGYAFLSDDVALVRRKEGMVYVYPSYPYKKLWEDAIEALEINEKERNHYPVIGDLNKHSICFDDCFYSSSLKLSQMFHLEIADVNTVQIKEVSGVGKMNLLVNNTYRSFLIRYCGLEKKYFDLCSVILDQVKMFEILRPQGKITHEQIAELIMERF